MIYYATNWMGPISLDWYRKRGLTEITKKVITDTDKFLLTKYSIGDTIESEQQTEYWSGGRIDVWGDIITEISLPVMKQECYNSFSKWLRTFTTDDVWTLDQLVTMYEKNNPKIIWAKDIFK